jgi:multidrug resistance protein
MEHSSVQLGAVKQPREESCGKDDPLNTRTERQQRSQGPCEEVPDGAAGELRSVTYTTFTPQEKRLLTLLVGLGAITSPLTATIYLPLLPLLRDHYGTTAQAINLTLTIYVVFQALSPIIFGPPSDTLGRRPVLILTTSIYCAGNIGLAINKSSYVALLVLRAVQSLGASAAYSVVYGIVADVCLPGERGRMLGPVNMALNIGTCIGPVIGGWVSYKSHNYEWVFWALVIVGLALLLSTSLFLPETARALVGNGSGRSLSARYRSLWSLFSDRHRNSTADRERQQPSPTHSRKVTGLLHAMDPIDCLRILTHRDSMLVLLVHGSFYVVDYTLVAAAPDIYKSIYHLNDLQVGLTYLPRGIGILTGSYFNGWLMDHNFRHVAEAIGLPPGDLTTVELRTFPYERARTRGSFWLLATSTVCLVVYGWVVWMHVHMTVPLILQYLLGFVQTCFYTIYSTLLVDSYPDKPSTAAAAASVIRCAMAATALAILQPMLEAMGRGWYFTALGMWSASLGVVAIVLLRTKGMAWRMNRSERYIRDIE